VHDERVERALRRVRGTPLEFASAEGLTVVFASEPHHIGNARFYGRLEGTLITVYPSERAVDEVVAHELYHWLDPSGPEEAARLFASRWISLFA
jgi:hypothetical protein